MIAELELILNNLDIDLLSRCILFEDNKGTQQLVDAGQEQTHNCKISPLDRSHKAQDLRVKTCKHNKSVCGYFSQKH